MDSNYINIKDLLNMKNILFILSLTLLISCSDIDNQIQGVWVIDEYDASFQMLTNSIAFKENNTCVLPMVDINERNTDREIGEWETFMEDGKYYLKIDTENPYFNNTYKIVDMRKIKDPKTGGVLMKMTLVSNYSMLKCTKAVL